MRYRALLSPYRLARGVGLSEDAWAEFAGRLDEALAEVDGRGFRLTPMTQERDLARAAGLGEGFWVKDETINVAGSHKARHLMGVMLYLRVLAAARLPASEGLSRRRLAIASCGNAALAAAVVARAADWPIDVFIPPDAPACVVQRLKDLGAAIDICRRYGGRTRRSVYAGVPPRRAERRHSIRRARSGQWPCHRRRTHLGVRDGRHVARCGRVPCRGLCAGWRRRARERDRSGAFDRRSPVSTARDGRTDGWVRTACPRLAKAIRRRHAGRGTPPDSFHVAMGGNSNQYRAWHSR